MKLTATVRAAALTAVVATLGCQDSRPSVPTAASLFIPNVEGVWSGPMTRVQANGGDCTVAVVETFLPRLDRGTLSITQSGTSFLATMTTESTGLACRYTGSATVTSLAMNATSCDRTGLLVTCANGVVRELRLVGSSASAVWNGDQITGQTTSTYNVFTPPEGLQEGVGSVVVTHDFTATRR